MSMFDSLLPSQQGTSIERVTTTIESICFPVARVPLYWNAGDSSQFVPEDMKDSGFCGILNVSTNETLYAGKEYKIIDNNVIAAAIKTLETRGWALASIRSIGDRKFYIDIRNPQMRASISVGDREFAVDARVRITNSYDGSLAFGIQGGFWIQVCGNGATAGDIISVKKKHQGEDVQANIIDSILSMTSERFLKAVSKVSAMFAEEMTPDTVAKLVEKLTQDIPDNKDGIHPVKLAVIERCKKEYAEYDNAPFAVFMAVTNITTYPQNYSVPTSYLLALERRTLEVFG